MIFLRELRVLPKVPGRVGLLAVGLVAPIFLKAEELRFSAEVREAWSNST
jgi:hypothetical protein